MRYWNRALYQLTSRLPLRVIKEDGQPYLERAYLGTVFGVRVYVHRFVASDPDRGLHDHPWPWAGAIVISGSYREELESADKQPGVRASRMIRYGNWLTGDTFHRVVLPEGAPEVWTIFFHRAQNSKTWGFKGGPLLGGTPSAAAEQLVASGGMSEMITNASGENIREWWTTAPQARFCADRVPPDSKS